VSTQPLDLAPQLKAVHGLLRAGRIRESFGALAKYFQQDGPTTPERRRLFTKAFANEERPDHIALQFASALLADGDIQGAANLYGYARPAAAAGADLFPLAVTSDLPAYCAARGYPTKLVAAFDLERFAVSAAQPMTSKAFLAGLPGGRVLGESFLPASADGHLFVERMVFNHSKIFHYDAGDAFDGVAVPARSRFLVRPTRASTYGPAVLLGQSGNFGHWFLNHVSRLALVKDDPQVSGLPVIVGHDATPLHIETLGMLGIPPERIIYVSPGEFAQFEMLWIPSQLFCQLGDTLSVQWSPNLPAFIRRALGVHDRAVGQRKLFFSRRSARWRRLVNEDEIFAALLPMGFESIECGGLSLAEQLALVGQAKIIVGPIGAAMALSLFAPKSIPVVDLSYPGMHMQLQRTISLTLGQRYAQVL